MVAKKSGNQMVQTSDLAVLAMEPTTLYPNQRIHTIALAILSY